MWYLFDVFRQSTFGLVCFSWLLNHVRKKYCIQKLSKFSKLKHFLLKLQLFPPRTILVENNCHFVNLHSLKNIIFSQRKSRASTVKWSRVDQMLTTLVNLLRGLKDVIARTYLQLPLRPWGAGNVYLLVLSNW